MPKSLPTRPLLLAALLPLALAPLAAQTHRVAAPEKVTRAISVYEWTGDIAKPAAARLIPVSLFIDNQFQDAGTYYARPVPLALFQGNVYSVERAGFPQGTFTVNYARHLQTAVAGQDDSIDLGWFGYGNFSPLALERKPRALLASSAPPVIVSSKDEDRPTFANRPNTAKPESKASKKATEASVTPVPESPNEDPDRPHFSKGPAAKPTDPSTTTPDTTTKPTSTRTDTRTQDPSDDADRPALRRRNSRQTDTGRSRSAGSALNDDPDRPNMKRGAVSTGTGAAVSPQLTGLPAGLHQVVAVSDPVDREPHPFVREWASPTEQAEVLAKVSLMAQQQVATYNQTNGGPQPPAKPVATRPGVRPRRPAPAHTPAPTSLSGEELKSYTLSYGGLPTFVYTATSGAVTPSSADPRPTTPALPPVGTIATPERYVTIVAQQMPSGELQLAFSSVTDAAHLDRTPWYRFVDVVDPDAEHRASLLFELRGQHSRQFGLYRIISARAEQIFITHPTD